MIKNNIPTEKKEKVLVSTLNGTFFHEKTESGFVQVNRIEGNSVQNGTPTPDNPIEVKSFDGEVVTSGKNLIDMEYLMNYFNSKLGRIVISKEADGSYKITNLNAGDYEVPITLNPNKRYAMRFKYKNNNWWAPLFQFKFTDGRFGDGMAENGLTNVPDFVDVSYVIPKGKVITNFRIHNANNTTFISWYKDFQLEVLEDGQEAPSSYEPFHATKTEKLTLRSLPNGVKDTLERQRDGSYLLTQRVSHFVFDKDEDIDTFELASKTSQDYDESQEAAFYSPRCNNLLVTGEENEHMYSNRFKYQYGYEIGNIFNTGTANKIIVVVSNDMLETRDATGFKKLLKKWRDEGKPLTVSGTLPTPIQRKVWLSPLSAYEGQTNIFANSEVGAEMEVEILTTNAVNGKLQELKENILQERPNPNLLVNADFRNPINTTGKTEWAFKTNSYIDVFDGWIINNNSANSKLLIKDGIIEIMSGDINPIELKQYFLEGEILKIFQNEKLTISCDYRFDGKAKCGYGVAFRHPNGVTGVITEKNINGLAERKDKYVYQTGDKFYFYFGIINGAATIKNFKVEIGERATPLEYVSKAQKQLETNGFYSLHGGNLLLSGTDLNALVNLGNYYCNSDLLATQIRNAPTKKAFTLKVESAVGETIVGLDQYPRQTAIDTESKTYMRQGFINTAGTVSWKEWTKTDSSAVGSEVPKLKFLAQPQLLASGQTEYKASKTVAINGGKGVYFFNLKDCVFGGINGKTGSIFKQVLYNSTIASSSFLDGTSSIDVGILFIDGVNKACGFNLDYGYLEWIDISVSQFDSVYLKATGTGQFNIYKIAEYI